MVQFVQKCTDNSIQNLSPQHTQKLGQARLGTPFKVKVHYTFFYFEPLPSNTINDFKKICSALITDLF